MLINLIREHALTEAAAGDWDAVAKILSEPAVIVRNPKSWTMADLIGIVGPQAAALIGGTIQAAGASNPIYAGAWIAMNVTGLRLDTDDRQQMIDGLAAAGSWPLELTAAVKSAGLSYASLAGEVVTAEQCNAAWSAAELQSKKLNWQARFDAAMNTIDTSEQADGITDLRAIADEMEAG